MPSVGAIFKEALTTATQGITSEVTLLQFTDADGFVDGHRYAVFSMMECTVSVSTMFTRCYVNAGELTHFRTRYRPNFSSPNVALRNHMGILTWNAGDVFDYNVVRAQTFAGPNLTVWNAKVLFLDLDSAGITEDADWFLGTENVNLNNIAKNDWTNYRHLSKTWTPDGTSDYLVIACTKWTAQTTASPRMRLNDSVDGVLPGTLVGARQFGASATTEHALMSCFLYEAPAQVTRNLHVELSGANGTEDADYTALLILRLQAFETFAKKTLDYNVNGFPSGSAYSAILDSIPYTVDSIGDAIFFNFQKWPNEGFSVREASSTLIELPAGNGLYQGNVPAAAARYRNLHNDTSDVSHLPQGHDFYFGKVTGMTPAASEQLDISINAFDANRKLRNMTTVVLGLSIPPVEGFAVMEGQSGFGGLGGFDILGDANLQSTGAIQGELFDLVLPELVSVVPTAPTTLRVTFDSPMRSDAALNDPSNYVITPGAGGAVITVQEVTPEAVTFPTYVDLTTTEHTDGVTYNCEVINVVSQGNNPINTGLNDDDYTGLGDKPQLASVEVKSSTLLRLNFSEEMILNSALLSPSNYIILPVTPGAAPLFFTEVITPVGDNFPDWVELPVSEMTDGASYSVEVNDAGPTDRALNTMDPGNNSLPFVGEGVPPGLARVVAISPNRVDVVFNEPMKDNADIRNPANYTWTGGLNTVDVLDVVGDTVQLVTDDQAENTLYVLTINY